MSNIPYGLDTSADLYDFLYSEFSYSGAAHWIATIAHQLGIEEPAHVLDVGGGTGRHAAEFRKLWPHADITVLDASAAMLAKIPLNAPNGNIAGKHGDMRNFELEQQFDIVTSLFAAISYLQTKQEVAKGMQMFASHTKPGGLVVIEPLQTHEMDGWPISVRHVTSPDGRQVVRMCHNNLSHLSKAGEGLMLVDMFFNYAYHDETSSDGWSVEAFSEQHTFGVFGPETYMEAMERAGLVDVSVKQPPKDLSDTSARPLIVGRKPSAVGL